MDDPPLPVNVRIERPDGTVIPLELLYEGYVDGTHEWVAVTDATLHNGDTLLADELPPRTAIGVPVSYE